MVELQSPNQTYSPFRTLLHIGMGTATMVSLCATDLPQQYMSVPLDYGKYAYECTTASTSCFYQLKNEHMPQENISDMGTAVGVIHSFVNDLIDNSKKSPAHFSKTVDDNFWDLA
jgi:hypothetical protein